MIEPQREKVCLREKAYKKIEKLVLDHVKDVSIHPFGSYVTKLFLPNADIDIVALSSKLTALGLLKIIGRLILSK